MSNVCLTESLARYLGQTVTIFTTSGGLSGEGFTGVLAFVGSDIVKLITGIGAAPSCSVGSPCSPNYGYGGYNGYNNNWNNNSCPGFTNWLGSITEIPICKIACFTHNAL
jgi:hypothetical protein